MINPDLTVEQSKQHSRHLILPYLTILSHPVLSCPVHLISPLHHVCGKNLIDLVGMARRSSSSSSTHMSSIPSIHLPYRKTKRNELYSKEVNVLSTHLMYCTSTALAQRDGTLCPSFLRWKCECEHKGEERKGKERKGESCWVLGVACRPPNMVTILYSSEVVSNSSSITTLFLSYLTLPCFT